jgi:hypothetical protein
MPQDHHSCRHRPEARDDYDVVVGWDPPLNTYFAQVAQGARVEDVESWDLILWAGGEYGEIQTVDQLKTIIAPYAQMNENDVQHLIDRGSQRNITQSPKRERNEDGMIRIPWRENKDKRETREHEAEEVVGGPDPNFWYRGHVDAEGLHNWWGENGEMATLWKEDGRWKMHFTVDEGEPVHVDLGKTRFVQRAYDRANRVLDTAQEAAREPTTEQLWNHVIQEASLREGGFASQRPNPDDDLMDLAKAIGHPRWAITAAIHDAMGATERAAYARSSGISQFPSNDELLKMVEEKHRAIGVVREDVESGQRIVESTPHTVAGEDLRDVVNLASEIEDITEQERASLDRLNRQLDRPAFDRNDSNGYGHEV